MDYKELMKYLNQVMIILAEEVVLSKGRDVQQAIEFVWWLYGRKLIRDGKGSDYDAIYVMYKNETDKVYGKEVYV